MAITLWQLNASPPSLAVRMLADILGVPLELKNIDFINLEHKSPEFRKMNPVGTIPVIQDGNFILPESHAIMMYLLEKYGKEEHRKLYPKDLEEKAKVDQILYFDTGVAFIRVKRIALPAIYEDLSDITPVLAKECDDVYETVELYLEGEKDFIASNQFTLADISLGTTILSLNYLYEMDTKRYPRTAAWLNRLRERPYFQNIAVPGCETLSTTIKACLERNKNKK